MNIIINCAQRFIATALTLSAVAKNPLSTFKSGSEPVSYIGIGIAYANFGNDHLFDNQKLSKMSVYHLPDQSGEGFNTKPSTGIIMRASSGTPPTF